MSKFGEQYLAWGQNIFQSPISVIFSTLDCITQKNIFKIFWAIKIMIISIYKGGNQKPLDYQYSNNKQKVVIGRNPKCQQTQTITLEEPSVSRSHLAVKLKERQLKVMDLGSSNGTKVNQVQIKPNEWVQINHGDTIVLGEFQGSIVVRLKEEEEESSSGSHSRSREKKKRKKFEDLCKQLKISDSSLKMLKQMTSQKKSKEQKIKFIKLMGCKNIEAHWQQIEQNLKNQNKYTNGSKRANQQLQKQFQSGRPAFEKKGLGSR